MLRLICLGAALLVADTGLGQGPDLTTRLWHVMEMDDLMPILRDEAVAEADDMQENLFQRGGNGGWQRNVQVIHQPDRLAQLFRKGLDNALPQMDQKRVAEGLTFYETPLGRRMLELESVARVAIMDDKAAQAATAAFVVEEERRSHRAAQIERLIDSADLVGPNVAGGMNAVIAFSQGFDQAGGYDMPMGEAEMLGDAWQQEAQLAVNTEDWLEGYLLLAYAPLSDEELDTYIDFAASAEGQALSGLLFAGFDAVFRQTSYELGVAAAAQLSGREL
ncbi:DUF2059 domain-containing protein [Paracoccus sp. 11-3]|uniref:DUF2059 domain-containing protein n=1 Tax=Paracoccus amoyensis TaxID=2760093 RepID=A0A926GCP9_9RHOB|nr:DUF2059 domain-containing protein [Paracoccus amoyensis]MBC9246031.1 DUF2059 domain-containing protein [Paracoccus amoyensis]